MASAPAALLFTNRLTGCYVDDTIAMLVFALLFQQLADFGPPFVEPIRPIAIYS